MNPIVILVVGGGLGLGLIGWAMFWFMDIETTRKWYTPVKRTVILMVIPAILIVLLAVAGFLFRDQIFPPAP